MRLTAIEMQGFKSFPDKTRINFDSGLTAIIGPNGSGKSNISDAVRWVLGEMSVKSLRGSKMEDVIFNGTATRPAANCASVSLTINTEEEYNRAHHATLEPSEEEAADKNAKLKLSDNPEIIVTRKYYRSGESEYYLNKKQVRLKDVYEIFYDTGIGREGYSVIGQGKISEVLSQKDEERRSIFEEAAGISKFRYKKIEAERKLRDTEANLVRVNDILSEISSRIGPLEKEAENAKQYLVLSREKKEIEITLWLDRIDTLRARRVEVEAELGEARFELTSAENEVARCDADTDRMLDESYEFARIMSECERTKTDTVHKKGDIEGRRAVCENDIAHARESVSENDSALLGTEQEIESASREITLCENECSSCDESLAEKERAASVIEESHRAASESRADIDGELIAAGEAFEQLTLKKGAILARIAASEASLEAMRKTEEENEKRLTDSREKLLLLENEKASLETRLNSEREKLASINKSLAKENEQIESLKAELSGVNSEINEGNMEVARIEQKRESLIRLENLLEGYSESVKHIISDSTDGKITDRDGKKVEVHGTVSNIISSDSEYVVALETALAAATQFIVVERESDAKACIHYLKKNRIGRATFLPIESVEGRVADVSRIEGMTGYIGIASECAKFDKKYRGIVNDLLGRTVIADNIENASLIARETGFRIKTVTLDGQVINPGGSYTGGSEAKKVGVFTRAMDIERLGNEIADLNKRVASLDEKAASISASILEYNGIISELSASASLAGQTVAGIETVLGTFEARIAEQMTAIGSLTSDEDITSALESELDMLKAELENAEQYEKELTEKRTSLRIASEKAHTDEEDLLTRLNDARVELLSAKNLLLLSEQRLSELKRRSAELAARKVLLAQNSAKSAALIAAKTEEIALLNTESTECDRLIAECESRLEALLAGREEKEKELSLMRQKQKQASSRKEEAFRRVTECEVKSNSVNTEYDTISEKMWDEYELTYSDALRFRLPKESMEKAPSRLASLKAKIRSMGTINVNAVEEYRQTKERYDFLNTQVSDLNEARKSLDSTISKLVSSMKETFLTCFDRINAEFDTVFRELFGGGSARVELTDPLMPLECGIDIVLKVPGKSVRSISLLSGGEQSFAAISLYLALQKVNPAPFCVFDEIESALDDVNLAKFVSYVRRNSDKTQYIMITHRRGTMERADTLYGITMRQRGISDYMRLNMAKLDESIKEYTE